MASLPRLWTVAALACAVGVVAGALAYLAYHSFPQAALVAGAAMGGAAECLDRFLPVRDAGADEEGRSGD